MNILQRFVEYIKEFISNIKTKLSKGEISSKIANEDINAAEEAIALIQKAFNTSARNASKYAGQNVNKKGGEVKHTIMSFPDGRKYVKADRNVISGDNPEVWGEQVKNYINEKIRNKEDVVVYGIDGDALSINDYTEGKASFRNKVTMADKRERLMTDDEYASKLRAESHIDEISEVSKRGTNYSMDYKNHPFAKDGFNYRTAYFEDVDGEYYKLTLSIGMNGEVNTVYNIGRMQKIRNLL